MAVTSGPSPRPRKARRCVTDDEYLYVAAWEFGGEGSKPVLHKEPLDYEFIELKQRSYK